MPRIITPEYVAQCFKNHGLVPVPYAVVPDKGMCCGLGAIAADIGLLSFKEEQNEYQRYGQVMGGLREELGYAFVKSFSAGFDYSLTGRMYFNKSVLNEEGGKTGILSGQLVSGYLNHLGAP
jgi:hypothetical protein